VGKPFGETRYTWGSTPTDRRFTGQRSEEATLGSLYDFKARFYSPVIGRFLSADTLVPNPSNPSDLNRYAYAANSPLSFIDPNGHQQRPPSTCGTVCYTGTTGPHVSEGNPPVQPLTVGTTHSSTDAYISAPDNLPDDGMLIKYSSPYVLYTRSETVIGHVDLSLGRVEYRQIAEYELFTGQLLNSGQQVKANAGLQIGIPGTGFNLGAGYAVGQNPGGNLAIRGELLGLGAAFEYSNRDLKALVGGVAPGAGPGLKVGLGVKMGRAGAYMISSGALQELGGIGVFDETYGQGGKRWPIETIRGQWINGQWISGYDLLRRREWLRSQTIDGYPYPQEVQ
jgi:RHS repeat-associated protein